MHLSAGLAYASYGSGSYFHPPLLGAKILALGFDSQALNFNNTLQLLILRFSSQAALPVLLLDQRKVSNKGLRWHFDVFNTSSEESNRKQNYLALKKKAKQKIRAAKF